MKILGKRCSIQAKILQAVIWIAFASAIIGLQDAAFAQAVYLPGTVVGSGTQHVGGTMVMALDVYNGKYYFFSGLRVSYQISDCGRFKDGQRVDYRVAGRVLYIRGKVREFSCSILTATDPLGDAAKDGDLEMAKSLLKDNPDLVFTNLGIGMTPLHWAADNGHNDVVELLLASKAEVDAKNDKGATPLVMAAGSGHKDVVEVLLAHGADINAKDKYGITPLQSAAGRGSQAVVEALLAHGADVNAKDNNGHTPLHSAAGRGSRAVVEVLLAHGADINAKDNNGDTPLDSSARWGDKDMAELLRQHGGQE